MATCRSCGSGRLSVFLSLGNLPLSDGFVRPDQLAAPEPRYPLDVALCGGCSLVQILETVAPDVLFGDDYPYYSSFSRTLLTHSEAHVTERIAEESLGAQDLVVEIASNDGYLLQFYRDRQIPVLGIDPALGPVRAARERGIPTLHGFFGIDLAQRLSDEGKKARVLHANNVLAHVADTNGFVEGIATLLAPNGVAVIEAPYVVDLVDHLEFDTIYHEHLCYFSVTALDHLFRRHDLYLNRVQRLPIHGGSLRLFVHHREAQEASVRDLMAEERRRGFDRLPLYEEFGQRVKALRSDIRKLVRDLQAEGERIVAYGAAAKGTILLNYAGLGSGVIDFVADRNVHKQGKLVPGVRIPIVSPERIANEMPDYVLILPWNLREEILAQEAVYRGRGGKFIVPVPRPEIV